MKLPVFLLAVASLSSLACTDGNVDSENNRAKSRITSQDVHASSPEALQKTQLLEDETLELASSALGFQSSPLSIEVVAAPKLGEIRFLESDGSWVYQPNANVFGIDQFTIRRKSDLGSKLESYELQIQPVNDSPNLPSMKLKIPEDSIVEIPIPVDDIDSDQIRLEILSIDQGQAAIQQDGKQFVLQYRPDQDFAGDVSIRLQASDEESSSEAELSLNVINSPDPIIAADQIYELNEDERLQSVVNFRNGDQQAIEFELVDGPQNGQVSLDQKSGHFDYQPNPDYYGNDAFSYRIRSGSTVTEVAYANIHVKSVNDHPGAKEIRITCRVGEPCYGQLEGWDSDHNSITYHWSSEPQYGQITDWNQHTGEFTYYLPSDHYQSDWDQDYFYYWTVDCYGHRSDNVIVIIDIEYDHPYWLIQDSFERDYLFSHDNDFHWRFLLDDNGKGLQESQQDCKDHICAKIFAQHPYGLGPMGHEDRSLFFFGREGESTHEIFLISKSFDLSHYRWVDVDFRYLIMDIGDNDSRSHEYTEEYLKVDVCLYGEYECGLNPVDPHKLRSDRWVTVFRNDPNTSNNHLNGRNHSAHDWQDKSFSIDLNHLESQYPSCHRSNFVFRFNSRLQDGFKHNDFYQDIEDAIAIDNVRVSARNH